MTQPSLAGHRRASTSLPHWLDRYTTFALYGLVAGTVLAMLAWTTYCRFFWPTLEPATWNAPSYTLVCWLYCSSYDPLWSNAAYLVAALGVGATAVAARRSTVAPYALGLFGVLALPLGLPALYEGYRRHRTAEVAVGGGEN